MVHNLRFLITTFFLVIYYSSTSSLAACPSKINFQEKPNPSGKCKKNLKEIVPPKAVINKDPLEIIKDLFKTIKEDSYNHSYAQMLEDVKAEHSIKYHKPNAPFFYSNDSFVMKDIVDLLLDDPDGYIDETNTKGVLMVYRDNNYHDEIEELFDREPLYRRDIPQPKKFQNDYLGLTATGPTNRVMVTLKIKGDEQNENTLEKRLAYVGNNVLFIDAFPAKGPPPPSKPKAAQPVSGGTAEEGKAEASKVGEAIPEEAKGEETTPDATKAQEAKSEDAKADESAPEGAKAEGAGPEGGKTEEEAPETGKAEESAPKEDKGEEGTPEGTQAEEVVSEGGKTEEAVPEVAKVEESTPKGDKATT